MGCGKSVCTKGRVCVPDPEKKGDDKCYLPRCVNDKTKDIFDTYTAGCFCAKNELFTSSAPNAAMPFVVGVLDKCEDGKIAKAMCECGATAVCKAGQECAKAADTCDGKTPTVPAVAEVVSALYVHAMPANLTDAKKFEICKNTNSGGKVACDSTAETMC